MKKLGIAAIGLITLFATSCNSVESRLEGEWDYKTLAGSTISESGKAEFDDDGYGKFGDNAFTWTINDNDELTITDGATVTKMENTENEKDAQTFIYTGFLNLQYTLELTK